MNAVDQLMTASSQALAGDSHGACVLRRVEVISHPSSAGAEPVGPFPASLAEPLATEYGGSLVIARQEPFSVAEAALVAAFAAHFAAILRRIDSISRTMGMRVRDIARHMDDAFVLIDSEMQMEPLNDGGRALSDALAGGTGSSTLPAYRPLDEAARETLQSGRQNDSEFTVTIQGRPRMLIARTVPIFNRRALAMVHDRSDENTLRAQIIQSEKLASIGKLVSGVAHEVNNPLTAIMGFAQLALSRDLDTASRREMQTIFEESERAYRIIQNLLAFARQRPPTKAPVSLNELIQRVADLRAYDARLASIDVVLRLDPALPPILGDQYELQQMLFNVIVNAEEALKAAGREGGAITITSRAADGRAYVEICDDGDGIDLDHLDHVFEPFYSSKPVGQGTGLGLSISYGIVNEHDGTITARNLPDGGACIAIDLPATSTVTASPPELETQEARSESPVSQGARILVVDDEPAIRRLLSGILAMANFDVEVADSAREALEILATGSFDAVISDLKMPVMDGPALFSEIQRRYPRLVAHTAFITGDAITNETREFLEASGRPYLEKPFRVESIRSLAEQLVGASAPSATAERLLAAFRHHDIAQRAHAADLHLDRLAGEEGLGRPRCAGEDDVARLQRHHL